VVVAFGLRTDFVPGSSFKMEIEIYGSRGRRAASGAWRGDLVLSFGVVVPSSPR
jgi:hypothetical protein